MMFKINVVPGCQTTELTPAEFTWDELRELFARVNRTGEMNLQDYLIASESKRTSDKDGEAWIPCSVIDQAGPRSQANMDKAYFLVLDIDTGMQLDDVKARIEGLEAVIHSSYSHTPEHPKWRVVLPLVEPVPAKDISKIFDAFQERFDGRLDASCGHNPACLYYLPSCPADARPLFQYEYLKGRFLDGQAILTEKTAPAPTVSTGAAATSASAVGLHAGVSSGGRNNAAFKLSAKLFAEGGGEHEVLKEVLAWNEKNSPPLDAAEVKSAVKSAMKSVARKSRASTADASAIVDDMNARYAFIKKLHRIYRYEFRDVVQIDALRHLYANTGIWVTLGGKEKFQSNADVWYRSPNRRSYTDITFAPGQDSIFDNKINLWCGRGAEPVLGDIGPWVALMDYLFAGDAKTRDWVEQWFAYPIRHPGAKLTTAVVLWSINQGVGKSMLGETIGKLYGRHFRTIGAAELNGAFNGWMRDCEFVLGEENSGSDHRADSNRLKALITGNTISVNEKYQPALELPNCANFVFTSNHPDAFHLDDMDRRFLVWDIPSGRQPDEFYRDFVDWRDNRGGLSALMDHLQKLDLTGFLPKGNAPMTEAKLEMIRHSKSDLERWVNDVLVDEASVKSNIGKEVATLEEITQGYICERHSRTTTTAMSKALRRHCRYASRRVVTGKGRKQLTSLINHDAWAVADSAAWVTEFEKPTPFGL